MGRRIEIPARIAGARSVLRPLVAGDVAAYAAAFAADPDLGDAIGSESDPDEASLSGQPERIAAGAAAGDYVELAIADPADDRLLGSVTLHSYDWRHRRAEVGFWLTREARGGGVATDAVGTAVDWAFDAHGLHRVEMLTAPGLVHEPKVLALARRLGFRREGLLRERNFERGRHLDVIMLAVLRDEWEFPPRP